MARPIFALAVVCVLASACSDKGSSSPQGTPAAQTPAPGSSQPAAANAPAASNAPAGAPTPTESAASGPSTSTPAASERKTGEPPTSATRTGADALTGDVQTAREVRDVTIPAGKRISVTLTTPLASDTSKVEDRVRGTLAQPIVVSGRTVVPAGAEMTGTVMDAKESGRVKGRASIAFQFERLIVGDVSHDIRTARISRQAASSQRDDLVKGGIGAGVGAIVGGIVGGGKGAAIGAGAGGAGAVLATKGKEVRLPAGTTVTTTLQDPLTLPVPLGGK